MSNPEVRDLNNPQQRLVVRDYTSGSQVHMYHGEVGATWTVDATTQFRADYASFQHEWKIEVTGDDQITVKAGSLVHNGTTYSWSDTIYTADANGNYQTTGGTVIVFNDVLPAPHNGMFAQVFIPSTPPLSGILPGPGSVAGMSEGPITEDGAATGSGSGDPFITPIF